MQVGDIKRLTPEDLSNLPQVTAEKMQENGAREDIQREVQPSKCKNSGFVATVS